MKKDLIKNKRNKTNIILIITGILYFMAITIFELFFANSELMSNILRNTTYDTQFNYSLFRIFAYILFFVLFIAFRKYFSKDLIISNSNKIKRNVIIIYSIIAIIGIVYITMSIFTKNVALPKIAMLYIIIIMGEICLIYISKNQIKNIIVITFTLAMIFVVTVDVNNAIDENKHFMSAYNISIGNFNYSKEPKTDKRFYEIETRQSYIDIAPQFFKNDFKEEIINQTENNISVTPAEYGILTYIPSGLGIAIAKSLSHNMADIYYAGRLFNLIAFMGLSILILKILPYKKNTFFVIITLPMLLLLSTVYSADMLAVTFTGIFIANCLRLYDKKETMNIKDIVTLIITFGMLCIPKSMAYIFVSLIVFILPIKKIIIDNKKYIPHVIISMILLMSMIFMIFSNRKVEDDARGGENISSERQIQYMKENPIEVVKLAINHTRNTMLNFDWLAQMNMSMFFCDISYAIFLLMFLFILYVGLTDTSKNFKIKDKLIFWTTFMLVFGCSSLILYLKITPVGSDQINGVQPRYLFPILPLIVMTLSNSMLKLEKKENLNEAIATISSIFLMLAVIGNIMVK